MFMNHDYFIREKINGRECWMPGNLCTPPTDHDVPKKTIRLFQPEIERLEKFYARS